MTLLPLFLLISSECFSSAEKAFRMQEWTRGDSSMDQSVHTASNLIAALARQLVGHSEKLPTQLENMYTELEQHRRRPSLHDLRQLLTALCSERDRTYVIVDAIDECEATHERRNLLPLLESLSHGSTRLTLDLVLMADPFHFVGVASIAARSVKLLACCVVEQAS